MKQKRVISRLALLTLIAILLMGCSTPASTEAPLVPDLPTLPAEETIPVRSEVSVSRTEYADTIILTGDGETVTQEEGQKNLRPAYDAGSCYRLEGNPYVITIFLDDDVSCWPEDKALAYLQQVVIPGQKFIQDNAAAWNVELEFENGYYASYGHPERPVKYDGVVETLMDGNYSKDILEQAALSLGFDSAQHMNERLQDFSGQDQIVYLLMLNKGGRSYSMCYSRSNFAVNTRDQALEYCVIFTGFTDTSGDTASDTIAHEMLHLFGAQDYYMPDSRKALAAASYPEDIMLCAMPDLEYFSLGDLTAYGVGWHDNAPEVLSNPDWWE